MDIRTRFAINTSLSLLAATSSTFPSVATFCQMSSAVLNYVIRSTRLWYRIKVWQSQKKISVISTIPHFGLSLVIHKWGALCQKQESMAEISNYIPQIMWDVITCSCTWYLFLERHSSYVHRSGNLRLQMIYLHCSEYTISYHGRYILNHTYLGSISVMIISIQNLRITWCIPRKEHL